jgi:hypothetical protein
LTRGGQVAMKKINIKIVDPNNKKQLEEALSNMIAYELANKETNEEMEEVV